MKYPIIQKNWQRELDDIRTDRDLPPGIPQPMGIAYPGSRRKIRFEPAPIDIMVQCPKCKSIETVQFRGKVLLSCRRFFQKDGRVFHDCGSELPCRLLH